MHVDAFLKKPQEYFNLVRLKATVRRCSLARQLEAKRLGEGPPSCSPPQSSAFYLTYCIAFVFGVISHRAYLWHFFLIELLRWEAPNAAGSVRRTAGHSSRFYRC